MPIHQPSAASNTVPSLTETTPQLSFAPTVLRVTAPLRHNIIELLAIEDDGKEVYLSLWLRLRFLRGYTAVSFGGGGCTDVTVRQSMPTLEWQLYWRNETHLEVDKDWEVGPPELQRCILRSVNSTQSLTTFLLNHIHDENSFQSLR